MKNFSGAKAMCGLVGILFQPEKKTPQILKEIIETFTNCLVFNEERGKKASGIALVHPDFHEIFKLPVPANEFIRHPQYKTILDRLGPESLILLGHTREPTKGSPRNNHNNHPICVNKIIGIHNGKIENDDHLFQELKFPRTGEVDSEIIFRIMAAHNPRNFNGRYLADLNNSLSMLRGSFTIMAVDLRQANRLIVVKKNRPLCLHYEPKWHALIFSSRYLFLRKAFGRQVIGESLEAGYIYLFDATMLKTNKSMPIQSIPLACYTPGKPDNFFKCHIFHDQSPL